MRRLITVFLLCSTFQSFSFDTTRVSIKGNHFIYLSSPSNTKALFFLHGGVTNPYFKKNNGKSKLDFILESNTEFTDISIENGYDLIIPISNDSLNWVSNPDYCFGIFKHFISTLNKTYKFKYISGFSDGGTGSFKLFYSNPNDYDGLVVFNGYPYHDDYASSVDYSKINSKKIIFFGTEKDETTPYEFMLTAYCKQKLTNANTYLYVVQGNHSFAYYSKKDFVELYDLLNSKNDNFKNEPIHGYIRHDELIAFYEFRKSIVRKYSFGQEFYDLNKIQQSELMKAK